MEVVAEVGEVAGVVVEGAMVGVAAEVRKFGSLFIS